MSRAVAPVPPHAVRFVLCTHGNEIGQYDGTEAYIDGVRDADGRLMPPDYVEFVPPQHIRGVNLSTPPPAGTNVTATVHTLAREPRDNADGRGDWRYVMLPASEPSP